MVWPIAPVANLMYSHAACWVSGSSANITAALPPAGNRPSSEGSGNGAARRSKRSPIWLVNRIVLALDPTMMPSVPAAKACIA